MTRRVVAAKLDRVLRCARGGDAVRRVLEQNNVQWRLTSPHRELNQKEVENLEWCFKELTAPKMEYGVLEGLARVIGANVNTVRGWRKQLLSNPDWRPNQDNHVRNAALTQEQEKRIRDRIVEEYLRQKRFSPS